MIGVQSSAYSIWLTFDLSISFLTKLKPIDMSIIKIPTFFVGDHGVKLNQSWRYTAKHFYMHAEWCCKASRTPSASWPACSSSSPGPCSLFLAPPSVWELARSQSLLSIHVLINVVQRVHHTSDLLGGSPPFVLNCRLRSLINVLPSPCPGIFLS